ncbi:hypothetical protein DD594_27040, partial [Enterobacter cloacae complex sp. 4DZ1-17B1]|uniref:hypothetical protein n=1 Tax=Enterobacter cloacae complex sp. 4DZ1-17B1 TaxID=2511991 RepID=UPI001026F47B
QFCEAFRPGDYQEKILDELANLLLQPKETFAELMTKTKSLVAKLPQQPREFMVKKWVEKALPKTSQQKLRESLRPQANMEDFVATATRIEGARMQFTDSPQLDSAPVLVDSPSDPLTSLRRELEALKLQRALQEERSFSLRQE